ncbi:MAG: hypothetical protein IPL61_17265 [Myxococcales bacterium]|nr:hypothetical protein [Myxococcales bacterium]
MLARAAATLALAAAVTIVAPAPARADAPLRVLILADAAEDDVVARVEGQVADLPVALARGPALAHAGALGAQLAAARTLARAEAADAVVWFVRDADGWIVHVADPAAGRLLVRRVDGGAGAMAASAALESAALVVRTALRGLAAGGEIGVAPEPVEAPAPAPSPLAPAPVAERSTAGVAPFAPIATVGWRATIDGDAAAGHHGLTASLGVARARWQAALALAYLPPRTQASSLATIEVDRQELGVAVQRGLVASARWRVTATTAVSAVRFGRATTATAGALTATDDRATWTAAIAPTLGAARRLGAGAWLELELGATALTTVPVFGVTGAVGFVEVGRPWRIEPTVGLRVRVGGGWSVE